MRPALRIIVPGLSTTVQDRGRHGLQAIGVPVSGAVDPLALTLANALVGNDGGAAALEIAYLGPRFEVIGSPVRLAICGADSSLRLASGRQIAVDQSVRVEPGTIVEVGPLRSAAVAVLAVSGGVDVPMVLGSRSTYLRGGFGGLDGRALIAGDIVPVGIAGTDGPELTLDRPAPYGDGPIRIVLGPQADYFTPASIDTFFSSTYSVTAEADRMGIRFAGPPLRHAKGFNIVSDGIAPGAIQVPGSGQPIILLADRQTVGGYPKIGTAASCDLPRLARLKPGDPVRFCSCTVDEALALRRSQEHVLSALATSLRPVRHAGVIDLARLYDENIIDGVVSAE